MMISLNSCNPGPQPIAPGKDNCAFCKMMVTDLRYCSEIVTKKGKTYKFDDPHCLMSFLHASEVKQGEIRDIYFADFTDNRHFIKAGEAVFFQSDSLATPMNGNIAAFTNTQTLQQAMKNHDGKILHWNDINK
ncbi:MAG: nitrous oxide reductase accessory protein NosL [Bacteroidetes bacterium]|nr:nitrous oxide reductase accessory protein NosL [Bacteroidota bacterium]